MEVREHFYSDDPSWGPADAKTTLPGAEYFFLGNGLIQAAVQVTPSEGATPVGLLIMDPETLGPKRSSLTFDPVSGLEATAVSLLEGETIHRAAGQTDSGWVSGAPRPVVEVKWRCGAYKVTERFFCPDSGSARLLRKVTVERTRKGRARVLVRTGVPEGTAEKLFLFQDGRGERSVVFEYKLAGEPGERKVEIALGRESEARSDSSSAPEWERTAACRFYDPTLDRFFQAAKFQLRAAVSASGRLDGSIWQYNLEWVRDQAFAAMALVMSGQPGPARTILERLLSSFLGPSGEPMDSSRLRPPEETEFDQNGVLLMAVEAYAEWTGDWDLVRKNWSRLERAALFPLRAEFRHPDSGLLLNRREFWERHEAHGIEPGLELAHQVFVSLGLEAVGRMAGRVGLKGRAESWKREAERLRRAVLGHPTFALVDGGVLIKRRGPRGEVQDVIEPPEGSGLPQEAPLFEPGPHRLNPDTSAALAIAWEFIDPHGQLARSTLAGLEKLWNERWKIGGYGRYEITSEPDSPGPWPFPSLFVARAAFEAGEHVKTRRVLDWLSRIPGGRAGSWLEFYGPRPVPPYPQVGIVPWAWAEIVFLCVHHMLGVRPLEGRLRIRPMLLRGSSKMEAELPVAGGRLELSVRRARRGEEPGFRALSERHSYHPYGFSLPLPATGDTVEVKAVIP